MTSVALTIAGSDPSGGAGLQADLKTFHQSGVYGASVVTLLTVQNTVGVTAIQRLDPGFVVAQLDAVLEDIPPQAAKTGALGSAGIIAAIAGRAAQFRFPLVVDPVLRSKHGDSLMDADALSVLVDHLLPHAFLLTPNRHEAEALAGFNIPDLASMERAAAAIAARGPRHVLVKGGGRGGDATDVLFAAGAIHHFPQQRIETQSTHGSGCVYSAAITARLARGEPLLAAIAGAKHYITRAIQTAPGIGRGVGPVNMHSEG
ncbi:MAG: bifunctional hydroxymethylpyrimidine kinase/phosphomethylpyrimidine kinase [Planctomycetota bacterium]